MEYIRSKRSGADPGCFLCLKPRERRDPENLILARGRKCYVVMNLYPYNNGHLMVAPYRHVPDLEGLTAAEGADLLALTRRSLAALRRWGRPQGFNVGFNIGTVAGAGETHLHQHIVPRWGGDTNYMPVLGETKVIVQHLRETYGQLRRLL
jgi:ATP adenylyltransferase